MFIYCIENLQTGDIYIGKTIQTPSNRWIRHKSRSRNGSNSHLHRAMRKYGFENFEMILIEKTEDENLLSECEKHWISVLKPEYNMTTGGEGGDTSSSPNYKIAMQKRDCKGERNSNYGKRGDSSPNFGKIRSEEQKEKMRNGIIKAWSGNETRRQLASQRVLGFENNPGSKKRAKSIEFDDLTFRSIQEAVRFTGRSRQYILKNGKFV